MLRPPTGNRRAMLRLMGSALATALLSVPLPVKAVTRPLVRLPGSLHLLPLHADLLRQARRRIQAHPSNQRLYQAAQMYLRAPDSPSALDRVEHHVRGDFVSGRVTVLDGWLVSETEVALLASVTPL